ncbi:hypothetical protein Tco_0254243, partial [Tanacetum coccineum]
MTNIRSKMTPAAIKEIINQRVTEALETREANRNIGLGNGNDEGGNKNGNGNGKGGGNGNENHNENYRDAMLVVQECTYQDFMKCQPLTFKGTEEVVVTPPKLGRSGMCFRERYFIIPLHKS